MAIETLELNFGEFVGIGAIEITSIPTQTILQDTYPQEKDIETEYSLGFSNLLAELYQSYSTFLLHNEYAETSFEFLWLTEPVTNQPFKAKISLYMVIRAIANDSQTAESMVERLMSSCNATLKLFQYGIKTADMTALKNRVEGLSIQTIDALVKDERIENLQNQMLPYYYAFDRFEGFAHDLSSVVNSLIEHPNCALSVQLIPTRMLPEEYSTITQITPMLDTLSNGVWAQGVGTVSFSNADNLSKTYRYYQTNSNNALFMYNFAVYGDLVSVEDVSSKLHSALAYDSTKPTALKHIYFSNEDIQVANNFLPLPWVINELLIQSDRSLSIMYQGSPYQSLYRMPYIITAEEAVGLFRLPIGTQRISAGLPINETESTSKTYADNLINAGDIEIGLLRSSGNRDSIGISLKDLAKHMLVVGTPGSGKTTFSVSLLDRLWKEHHIPFLVIEPAKNEYRALIQSIPELQVFTPGKYTISPFVFNPFVPPKNVILESYKSTLKTAFAAAVSMTTPLDKIFEESINNCYSDYRWLDTYTSDDKGLIFNIDDFIKCFQNTFDRIGYTGDAKNIGRAGVVRLNSLSNLFDNYFSIPIQDLLEKPTVIELAAIENSDQKALIIALLLLSILAYVNANYVGEGGLKNLLLLEEAHVLLDAETNLGQDDANPSAIAQDLIKRMLAEIRSYGVGIVIADQSPRKVTDDVVAMTDIKMVFRLVEATDKQIIADSMNMSEAQVQRLARLKPGEAFLFFNRLDEPEEVITPDYRLENNISITLSDDGIRKLSTYWNNKQEFLRPYPECAKTNYCNHSCDYSRRILAKEIARRIYSKHFTTEMTDFDAVRTVFSRITSLLKAELNDEPFSAELLSCVKVHLWREIRYGTKIPISDVLIENSLKKT